MPAEPAKARRGCLFYVGLTGAFLLIAVLVATLLGLHMARKLYNQFTDTRPMPMPAVQLSRAQIDAVQRRVDAFRESVRGFRTTPPLTLSAQDLNALIQSDPDFEPMKGKLYVKSIQNGLVTALISLPMEQAGLPMFKGRYLNATATLSLSLKNGILRLTAQSVSAKGRPLPQVYLDRVRQQNLAHQLNSYPRVSVALDRLQSIEVKDSQVVVVPKPD